MTRHRWFAAELLIAALVVASLAWFLARADGSPPEPSSSPDAVASESPTPKAKPRLLASDRTFDDDDPVTRACALPSRWLVRIWRGNDPVHSEDITAVPLAPNYSGTFDITSHTGPWDYVQRVPLVLYGPERIAASGTIDRHVNITDVFPTVGTLTGIPLPERGGTVLDEALRTDVTGAPKLILTVVWDGVGRNVLERWPRSWPVVKRMQREGTSYYEATVGSSPSITPATHASLGTGAFPREHRVTAIQIRDDKGDLRPVFPNNNMKDLELSTYADEIDRALDNKSIVSLIGYRNWHLGMLGHGRGIEGGDADQIAIMGFEGVVEGNDAFWETPSYLHDFPGLQKHADYWDRSDGQADGRWRGNPTTAKHGNPSYVDYQTDMALATMRREEHGLDETTDMFFINYKVSDIIGHQHTMDSQEMRIVVGAQDAAMGRLLDYLDRKVKDYVVIFTADHGHTPAATRSGAWPVSQSQLIADVNARFGAPEGETLVRVTSAAGPFLNLRLMDELGVTPARIARFLNGYTIRENWDGDLPAGYGDRGDENVFAAAFAKNQLPEVMQCAFGAKEPPPDAEG